MGGATREADVAAATLGGPFRRSLHIRHVDTGSDGAVEQELAALLNPYYDMHRLGMFFTATPRHADVLLVTGPVTRPMEEPLRRTYEAMPEPRVVVAAGTDACSGSIWTAPEVLGGVDRVLRSTSTSRVTRRARSRSCMDCCSPPGACVKHPRHAGTTLRWRAPEGPSMSALAILMIVGCGGLALASGFAAGRTARAWRLGAAIALAGSAVLAAAGFVAVFAEQLVWQPFHWFGLGRGGVHLDQLAGLFLILTGVVSALLFLAASTEGPGAARVLRPCLVLCVVGVIVVDNVFEFLIVFELTVVAIYALISVRYEDPPPVAPPSSR